MNLTRRGRGGPAVLLLGALLGALPMIGSTAPAAAAEPWAPPALERVIGGTGRAAVYAWGVAHNPVTDEIVVSDHLNFVVRRYDRGGRHLGDLPSAGGETWSVAVDPRNGDILVADNWGKRILRYDAAGARLLSTISTSRADYAAWVHVDATGVVWVADSADWSWQVRIDRYRPDGTYLGRFLPQVPFPNKPTMFGIHVTAAGEIVVPDGNNSRIHVLRASDGAHLRSFGVAGTGPGLLGGDLRGLTVDEANGSVYVSDAGQNDVEKYALDGTHLATLGGTGTRPGQFNGPRQLAVDGQGDVWVADYGNVRLQHLDSGLHVKAVHPEAPQAPPAGQLAHANDAVVDRATGDVWVADNYNQRFQRFLADGSSGGTWGRRGGTGGYGLNYPSTVGFDPVHRRVWVGNEEGRNIKVYDEHGTYLAIIGQQAKTPEDRGYLDNLVDIDFHAGHAYLTDKQANVIRVLDAATYEEVRRIPIYDTTAWSYAYGLAIDPVNGDLYLASERTGGVQVRSNDGTLLRTIGRAGDGDGQFRQPRDVALVGDVVYVVDTKLSRIQAFTKDGRYLGRWGGWGSGPYQLRNPMGIDADDAGRLYVSDVENNRVVVLSTTRARPAFAWSPPTVELDGPAQGEVLERGPLVVRGTARDAAGLANVEVGVQEVASGRWWDGRTSSWVAAAATNLAPWSSPAAPATAAAFTYTFPALQRGAEYRVVVSARNLFDTPSRAAVERRVRVADVPPPSPPELTVTGPAAGAVVAPGTAVAVTGRAVDDLVVAAVEVAIEDLDRGGWASRAGGMDDDQAWLPATLERPGTAATAWRLDWAPPAGGRYAATVRAVDGAGATTTAAAVPFAVVDTAGDDVAPDVTTATPAAGAHVLLGPVAITGTAVDDRAVGSVGVGLQDLATKRWWRADGSWGAFQAHDARLDAPGAPTTGWAFNWTPPQAGSYGLFVRVIDAAGNLDPTRAWSTFTAVAPTPDVDPPDATVASPTTGATLPLGPVAMAGAAADDVGVAAVQVAVQDLATRLWLRADGTWGATQFLDAALAAPGATSTTWTWSWTPPAAGDYGMSVRAVDGAGRIDPTKPWVRITVR